MVEASPTTAFMMPKSQFLLQFLVIALDDPSMMGQPDQRAQPTLRRLSGQPVFGRFGFAGRPFDQQPFFRAQGTPVRSANGRDVRDEREPPQSAIAASGPLQLRRRASEALRDPLRRPRRQDLPVLRLQRRPDLSREDRETVLDAVHLPAAIDAASRGEVERTARAFSRRSHGTRRYDSYGSRS